MSDEQLTCCTLPHTAHCPHALVDGRCPVRGCLRIHHGREYADVPTPGEVTEALRPIYTEDVTPQQVRVTFTRVCRCDLVFTIAPLHAAACEVAVLHALVEAQQGESTEAATEPPSLLEGVVDFIDDIIRSANELHHEDNLPPEHTQYWQGYANAARTLRGELVRTMKRLPS